MNRNKPSEIRNGILVLLEANDGEISGTQKLTRALNTEKKWFIECVRFIERCGLITIIPSNGGRGNRTVYRRNRNSPGQPRKRA